MSELFISVVIPAYNAENHIDACIKSIIAQSYKKWEVIIIDDGSVDNTLEKINNYQKDDHRIRIIHQENAGPGKARNKGIENANGDYIVFIDSDDTIHPDYFDRLSKCNAEVVFIDIDQITPEGKILAKEYMSKYQHLERDDFIRYQMTGKIPWGGVRKAVKRNLLIDHNIRYSSNSVGEEAIYSFLLLHYAKSVEFLSGSLYTYVNHPGSQSSLQNDDPLGDVANKFKDALVERNLCDLYGNTMNAFFITSALISLDRVAQNHSLKEFIMIAKRKREYIMNCIDRSNNNDYHHLDFKAKVIYPFFKIGILTPIYLASRIKNVRRKMGTA